MVQLLLFAQKERCKTGQQTQQLINTMKNWWVQGLDSLFGKRGGKKNNKGEKGGVYRDRAKEGVIYR
jgi:hypothetical protein